MSTFTQVREYGEDIRVICTDCNINQKYDTYKTAVINCKTHRLWHHPNAIDWTSW